MKKVKKKKFSIKKTLRIIIPLFVIIIFLLNLNRIKIYLISKSSGYSEKIVETFLNKDIDTNIINKKYSKTLEKIINTEHYNDKYINDYLDINYLDKDNYLKDINTLLTLGYTSNEINTFYEKLNSDSINIILESNYLEDLLDIINISYFKEDFLSRYIKYLENKDYDNETAITYVNIGLDNDYYTNVIKVENQEDILVLVNKYNHLDSNYIPNDLKTISSKYQWMGRSNSLRNDAKIAFEEMCEAAKKDNIYIYAGSGYRSYSNQKYLYNTYVQRDGFNAAETYSARAGYSEHQTGLAMDIANKNDFISKEDKEYEWLINNSYKYGYILRYPEGKEKITGYMYEEWHYRYVGKETAKEVYESNLTYDEFIAKK